MFRSLFSLAVASSIAAGSAVLAQGPTFDAVSIKVNRSGEPGGGFGGRPGGLQVRNYTLRDIIRNAWGLNALQLVGGPDWIIQDRFDILATAPGGSTPPQMLEMMKAALADRFKLKVHTETRQMPIYALMLARPDGRLGPRMRATNRECTPPPGAPGGPPAGTAPPPPPPPAPPLDGIQVPSCGTRSGVGQVTSGGVALEAFTRNMAGMAGRMIVDKTGLTGRFDYALSFNMDPANASPDLPSVFAAIQEQMGLKLEAQTGPVDVLVIESAERPAEN